MSSYFGTRYSPDASRRRVWKAICEYLERFLPEGAAVLELGAGYCDFINQIGARRKVALDHDEESRRHCDPSVEFLLSDVTRIALDDRSMDVVFASNLLEHLTDVELDGLFAEVRRVLRPRGRLLLVQPNYHYCYREYWDDFTHKKAFSHVSLADMVQSKGFRVLALERRFIPFSFKSLLPKSYFLTRLYLGLPWRPMAKQMLLVAEMRPEGPGI